MRLGLDDMIELRLILGDYAIAMEELGEHDPRIQRWQDRVNDGLADKQRQILTAAVQVQGGR